jgi:hypothetical protein
LIGAGCAASWAAMSWASVGMVALHRAVGRAKRDGPRSAGLLPGGFNGAVSREGPAGLPRPAPTFQALVSSTASRITHRSQLGAIFTTLLLSRWGRLAANSAAALRTARQVMVVSRWPVGAGRALAGSWGPLMATTARMKPWRSTGEADGLAAHRRDDVSG